MHRQMFQCMIGFHSWTNCFGYAVKEGTINQSKLPPNLSILGFFRIKHYEKNNTIGYVQIFGIPPFSVVLLNATFARLLGFEENDEVILESIPPPLSCESVELAPLSNNDYQILESGCDVIENNLMSQIRIVNPRMRFPFFMSSSMSASFKVVSISPCPPDGRVCILNKNTELHIQSAPSSSSLPTSDIIKRKKNNAVEKGALRTSSLISSSSSSFSLISSFQSLKCPLIYRILPSSLRHSIQHPSIIYGIDKTSKYTTLHVVRVSTVSSSTVIYSLLIRLPYPSVIPHETHDKTAVEATTLLKGYPDHIIASSSLFSHYERILLNGIDKKFLYHSIKAYITLQNSFNDEIAMNHIQSLITSHPLLMTSKGISIRLPGHSSTVFIVPDLTTVSSPGKYCFVVDENTIVSIKDSESDLDTVIENSKEEEKENHKFIPFERNSDDRLLDLPWQKTLTDKIIKYLEFSSSSSSSFEGQSCLILGPPGSGKSEQLRNLAESATLSSRAFCTYLLDGTSLKGRSAENIEKFLSQLIDNLSYRSPSLLLIDNIDLIAPSQEEETRMIAVERIFTVIWRLLYHRNGVHLVCTANRLSSIHHSLIGSGGGRRFFHRIENIQSLDQEGREKCLRTAIDSIRKKEIINDPHRRPSLFKEEEWNNRIEETARNMENSSIDELVKIVKRTEIEAWMPSRDGTIMPDDLLKVASEWRKRGEKESTKGGKIEKTLRDVGGMYAQKKLMQEVMLWPYKYSSLFSRFRLRLGRGIILHGPSGCGKTLLAQAMIAHSGFNLISVKGPELLSKYIGSSEENVRNVFERARSSAPSVLFFDEIDSLAPRRGSDTSGVSDRVVNQLLTEMDGAEGLTGVFVLGATSRLDLIDEALIRPGRFDYSIHCGLPNEEDRLEILEVLIRQVRKEGKKMNLKKLVKMTEGWSGADLKTLTTNAYFAAVSELKVNPDDADEEVDEEKAELTVDHLFSVLDESRPRKKNSEKALGIEREFIGKSATLA